MASSSSAPLVQFAPLHTAIAPALWSALAAHKIEHAQLADAPLAVRAHYAPARRVLDRQTGNEVPLPPSMVVEGEALADG
jgi:ubiquitin-like modifier-activating enzyme ATG7